jgi:hypothetical protein
MVSKDIPVEVCARSKRLSIALFQRMQGDAPALPRHAVTTAALLLAHEHHSAIVQLVATRHFASATTLIRPMIEAVSAAAWALYVAPVHKVEEAFIGEGSLPKPSAMHSQLHRMKGIGEKVSLKPLMDGAGRVFHQFTHGDVMQLKRRFSDEGTTYSLTENAITILLADLMLMYGASILLVTKPTNELADFVRNNADSTVDEFKKLLPGQGIEWKGWEPLPEPTVDLGCVPESFEALRQQYLGRANIPRPQKGTRVNVGVVSEANRVDREQPTNMRE